MMMYLNFEIRQLYSPTFELNHQSSISLIYSSLFRLQFKMKKTIVKLAVFLCLLIGNVQVNGHQWCITQKVQTTVMTKGCGLQQIITTGCRGYCASESQPRLRGAKFVETCNCCRPLKSKVKRVLVCDSPREERLVPVARKCACRPCTII